MKSSENEAAKIAAELSLMLGDFEVITNGTRPEQCLRRLGLQ